MDNNKLKNLKLVVFDLDGTLLSNEGKIGEQSCKLIRKLESYGVQFSFATGRLHSAITDYASELEINTPLITLDGSYIKSYPGNNIIFESFLKEKYVKKALSYAEKNLINIALCHADSIYYTEENSLIPQMLYKFGAKYEEVPSYDGLTSRVLEIVYAGDRKRAVQEVRDRMSFPFTLGLETSYFRSRSNDDIFYLEIRRKGSSKGEGFLHLLKHLKLKQWQAAVVGDWYNDVSLFQTKALKVAVANAVPEIKRMSDYVTTKSNHEDGTAEFLELILKSKTDK